MGGCIDDRSARGPYHTGLPGQCRGGRDRPLGLRDKGPRDMMIATRPARASTTRRCGGDGGGKSMQPVQLFCWHFMAYPHLPADFDQTYPSGWVTVPNALWDHERGPGVYQEYIDQLAYADELGFDGLVLNEHHQNI
jgi:hypothetical protein